MKAGESLPDPGGQEPPVGTRKIRSRGQKSRDGAPRGAAHLGWVRAHTKWTRRSVLHPLDFARGKDWKLAYPGPVKNTGDDARPRVIPHRTSGAPRMTGV
jgi:hypothetical protein